MQKGSCSTFLKQNNHTHTPWEKKYTNKLRVVKHPQGSEIAGLGIDEPLIFDVLWTCVKFSAHVT